jgi:hypothetical protein
MAATFPQAQEQKSFGSFLQKRTFFLLKTLIFGSFTLKVALLSQKSGRLNAWLVFLE